MPQTLRLLITALQEHGSSDEFVETCCWTLTQFSTRCGIALFYVRCPTLGHPILGTLSCPLVGSLPSSISACGPNLSDATLAPPSRVWLALEACKVLRRGPSPDIAFQALGLLRSVAKDGAHFCVAVFRTCRLCFEPRSRPGWPAIFMLWHRHPPFVILLFLCQ